MLNKEEIEKAKENVKNSYVMATKHCLDDENKQLKESIETLLQYIDQLELEKDTLRFIQWCDTDRINQLEQENNKQNKIIDEMAKVICMLDTFDNYDTWNNDISEVKQYFEKKVNESNG